MRSNASSDHSAVFLPTASTCQPAIPALLKAQSSRPYVPTTAWTIDRTSVAADIAGQRYRLPAGGVYQSHGFTGGLLHDLGDRDASALACEGESRGATNPTTPAGD